MRPANVILILFLSKVSSSFEAAFFDDSQCKSWPKVNKLPIECCMVPELFKVEVKEKCISNCTQLKDPMFHIGCCATECIFEDSSIGVEGVFINENAKALLTTVFETNDVVMKVLDSIVDDCEQVSDVQTKSDPGKAKCATSKYGAILSCIYQELFKVCPESRPDTECKEIKDFIDKCPKQLPPKPAIQKSANLVKDKLGDAIRDVLREPNAIGSKE